MLLVPIGSPHEDRRAGSRHAWPSANAQEQAVVDSLPFLRGVLSHGQFLRLFCERTPTYYPVPERTLPRLALLPAIPRFANSLRVPSARRLPREEFYLLAQHCLSQH